MPIGKARQLLRGRKVAEPPHDPHGTEAYESGWYALLVQHGAEAGTTDAAEEGGEEPGAPEASEIVAGEGSAEEPDAPEVVDPPTPEEAAAARLAEVTILALRAQATDGPGIGDRIMRNPAGDPRRDGSSDRAGPSTLDPSVPRSEDSPAPRAARSDPASIRIGVRRVEDPARVYLDYLTASPHRDFFRADWWPASGPITPVHLWRANHLGAAWDVESIERFMSDAAALAGELVASAPRSAPVGSPERRAWQARFVSSGWVREFGVGRVSKTLHPMLPELVADLDPAMMAWARRAWFGLDEPADAEDPELWLEVAELLEDVLVLRSQPLGQIARRLRRSASGIAPVSRMGPVLAAFWDGYWTAMAPPPIVVPADLADGARRRSAPNEADPPAATSPNGRRAPAAEADTERPSERVAQHETRPRPRAKRSGAGPSRTRAARKTSSTSTTRTPTAPKPTVTE